MARRPDARYGAISRREMLYMRSRSDQQHATNASTRGRLLWVEVLMMFGVLVMGLWQIRYLREFFKQKKVI